MTTVDALKFLNSSPKSRIRDLHCLLSWSSFCPVMFICILFAIIRIIRIILVFVFIFAHLWFDSFKKNTAVSDALARVAKYAIFLKSWGFRDVK